MLGLADRRSHIPVLHYCFIFFLVRGCLLSHEPLPQICWPCYSAQHLFNFLLAALAATLLYLLARCSSNLLPCMVAAHKHEVERKRSELMWILCLTCSCRGGGLLAGWGKRAVLDAAQKGLTTATARYSAMQVSVRCCVTGCCHKSIGFEVVAQCLDTARCR